MNLGNKNNGEKEEEEKELIKISRKLSFDQAIRRCSGASRGRKDEKSDGN